jgi:dTDP-4-amino-4,6-dideoxygalactose transaminase
MIADAVRLLRDQGQRSTYEYVRPGFNFRMTELQAALGVAQLARLDAINDARRRNARMLTAGLDGVEGLVLPRTPVGRTHVFHQYTVRVTEQATVGRDVLQQRLAALGIATGVYYPRPVFEYECFRADPRVGAPATPRAARIAHEVLSLPVHPRLARSDIEHIVDGVRKCLS